MHATGSLPRAERTRQPLGPFGILVAFALVAPPASVILAFGRELLSFPPGMAIVALQITAAALVLFVRRAWSFAAAAFALAPLVFILMSGPAGLETLVSPGLGLEYVVNLTVAWALAVGLVSAALAFRAARGRPETLFGKRWPLVAAALAALVVGMQAAALEGIANPPSSPVVVALEPEARVIVLMEGDRFLEPSSTVPAGALLQLSLRNDDAILHAITTMDGAVDADTPAGITTTVWARAPATPGPWGFFCKYHAGMTGVLEIV